MHLTDVSLLCSSLENKIKQRKEVQNTTCLFLVTGSDIPSNMFRVDYLLDSDVTPPWSPTCMSSLGTAEIEVWLRKPVRDNCPLHIPLNKSLAAISRTWHHPDHWHPHLCSQAFFEQKQHHWSAIATCQADSSVIAVFQQSTKLLLLYKSRITVPWKCFIFLSRY